MATLVIRDALPLLFAHNERPGWTEDDSLQRIQKVLLVHGILFPPGGEQGRLIDQVAQVSTNETWCDGGNFCQVYVSREWNPARMDFQYGLAADLVGRLDDDPPIESSGSQEGLVQYIGPVRGGQ